jgi:hypothetical protein
MTRTKQNRSGFQPDQPGENRGEGSLVGLSHGLAEKVHPETSGQAGSLSYFL